jgi:replicative DNA helicase
MFTREPIDTADAAPTPQLTPLRDLLGEWETASAAARESHLTGQPRGPVTSLPTLDKALGGVLEQGLYLMHGNTGAGKTAMALQIAATCGAPAMYVSTEMSRLELFRRVVARTTKTYMGRLKSGELEPSLSLSLARNAIAATPDLTLADATLAFADVDWLRSAAELTRGASEHLLIVVDSVHSWVEMAPAEASEYEKINYGLSGLRKLAAVLRCPILMVAERNRASMGNGGVNAAAGSRRFEYGAEGVLELNRAEDASPNAHGELPVELKISKNRHGAPGQKVKLIFHGAMQEFVEAWP